MPQVSEAQLTNRARILFRGGLLPAISPVYEMFTAPSTA